MQQLRAPFIASLMVTLILLTGVMILPRLADEEGMLTVAFLDVGQGDAIFIESPSGTQVLIDGGMGGQVLASLSRVTGFFDRDIDMILATHPDADHIGGLVDVLEHYTVQVIVMTENESDSPVFAAFERAVEAEGATLIFARAGQVYDLGEGSAGSTTLSILFPDHDPRELQSNSASIVARLSYGESSYLLTGDSPSTIEGYLIAKEGRGLSSDILKLGHHGSKTSTDDAFLEAVHPTLGIISAGKDNEYGHPHPEVLTRLQQHGVAYENTAEKGSIVSVSDGKEIWLR